MKGKIVSERVCKRYSRMEKGLQKLQRRKTMWPCEQPGTPYGNRKRKLADLRSKIRQFRASQP